MSKSENIQTNRTEDGGLPPRQRHMVLGIMMAGTTAACISQSMMIAALPTIMQEFLVGAGLAQLITTAYIFTLGLFSAMSAYLVSKLDARRLFFIAMVGFIVGCCASLFATNYPVLLASRLVQAIGAGILLPLIQVVALSIYPKSHCGNHYRVRARNRPGNLGFHRRCVGVASGIRRALHSLRCGDAACDSVFAECDAQARNASALRCTFCGAVLVRRDMPACCDGVH